MPVVGVTGLNATDNPGPGVAVIQAIRHDPTFDGSVVGLGYDVLDPGLHLPGLVDHAFLLPYPSAGRGALIARLAEIKSRVGLDVLLPTLDSELPALLDQEDTLASMGIATYLPTRAQFDRISKTRLHKLNADGITVPEAIVLHDVAELFSLGDRMGFPCVVKGRFYGAVVATSFDGAVRAFHSLSARWGLPVIVQRFVDGDEVNVAMVGDGQGGLVGAVPMRKMMLTANGKGWAGVTVDDPALLEVARRFAQVTGWRGPCELELHRDRSGTLHLLEVNPRFPAWCDLTAGAGQNLPRAVVDLALGAVPGPLPAYQPGIAFVRISQNLIAPISALDGLSTHGERLGEESA
jgi:carbamoyl-phosphate synthase large subunit